MPLSPEERWQENLRHARWLLTFRQSLLDAHRALANRDEVWEKKEWELLAWVADARTRLERLEQTDYFSTAA